jgi:TrmH family RNA methyltransferase
MLSKNELKYIQSLYQKKQRDADRVFIAEGPKLADELINSTFKIRQVYALENWLRKNDYNNLPVKEISAGELDRISNLQTPNEVVVVAEQSEIIDDPLLDSTLSLVLDGIQDPGNMGTIIRIADWFGIQQIICSNDCVEAYNPKVVQSTMGSIARVKCWYKDLETFYVPASIPVYGAVLYGMNVYRLGKVSEGLLVIGNESKGIRAKMQSIISKPVTIPRRGGAESLNAAVATAIILGSMVNSE